MENKENIDQLFKNGLLEPDIPFDEKNWEKMSNKLDFHARKRRIPVWLIWGSAVAAALIIAMFWMFFRPNGALDKQPQEQVAKQRQSESVKPKQHQDVNTGAQNANSILNHQTETSANAKITSNRQPVYAEKPAVTDHVINLDPGLVKANQVALNPKPGAELSLVPFNATITTSPPAFRAPTESYAAVVKNVKKKMKTNAGRKSSLTLSAMLAPDISYAKSSIASKVSSNAGLLATYGFTPKLSVTTGAIYSNKYYNSNIDGVNAYNTSGARYQVNASCNVLDIPLNVNYKLLDKKVYSITVNTGLSSYLMLKEKYDYIYPQAGASPNILTYQVSNENKHILGVANVAVTIERKISSNLTIGVQPFMKVPLTGIGAGDARLKSSGLSFSLNIGLFPARKPGKFAGLRHY